MALISRSICNAGFIERPIVLALLWGLCTGEYGTALALGVFYELFWLDLFPIGSYAPPMPAFPFLLLLALANYFFWNSPETLTIPLAVTLPLAYIPSAIEVQLRKGHAAGYLALMHAIRSKTSISGVTSGIIARSAFRQCVWQMCAFVALLVSAYCVFQVEWLRDRAFTPTRVNWSILYAVAALGALMALRIRRIYFAFGVCMALLLLPRL